jgi:GGDEF domain-containing protein
MDSGPPRRRRARPVADAPIEALLAHTEELAKGWLLAVLEQAPLVQAPEILAAELAREGPQVCEAIVRALANDGDLRRIEPGGGLELVVSRVGRLAGARDAEGTLRAVDALEGVIWSALRDALSHPDPDQVSELAERLWLVGELVRRAAFRLHDGSDAGEPRSRPDPDGGAVADVLWVGALDHEIARSRQAATPLSLLLVELDEAERVTAVEPASAASATFGRFAQAVRSVLRPQHVLACETDTRLWVMARDTTRPVAQALGSRIASTVRAVESWRGAPLTVGVGVAVLGQDGHDRESLLDAAEEARFAALASGVEILGPASEEAADDQSSGPGAAG